MYPFDHVLENIFFFENCFQHWCLCTHHFFIWKNNNNNTKKLNKYNCTNVPQFWGSSEHVRGAFKHERKKIIIKHIPLLDIEPIKINIKEENGHCSWGSSWCCWMRKFQNYVITTNIAGFRNIWEIKFERIFIIG